MKISFPLIYAVFFVVQCLVVNFDACSFSKPDHLHFRQALSAQAPYSFLVKSKTDGAIKIKFHLNKRFQPGIIAWIPDLLPVPFEENHIKPSISYVDPDLADSFPDTSPLRGPPQVS